MIKYIYLGIVLAFLTSCTFSLVMISNSGREADSIDEDQSADPDFEASLPLEETI